MCCTPLPQYNCVVYWGGDLAYAAVNDNVESSRLVLLVGKPAPDEPQTVFDWFRKVWLTLSTVDTNTAQLAGKIDAMSVEMASMKSLIKSQNATVGGGCYFTLYTYYPFLETFKVKVTDNTSSKSSYINYNDDSGYYSAELRVPTTSSTVYVHIMDPETNAIQLTLTATGVNTTSGYANINLDPLFNSLYATPLQNNNKLATVMYKSDKVTKNTSWLPTVVNYLYLNQEHLPDFVKSCGNVDISANSLDALYASKVEFVNTIGSDAGKWLLNNANISTKVANDRGLLRWIIDSNSAVSVCESSSVFTQKLAATTLTRKTQSAAGGALNVLQDGHYLCISVISGCRGGSWSGNQYLGTDYYPNNDWNEGHKTGISASGEPYEWWGCASCSNALSRYLTYKAISVRGTTSRTLNNSTTHLIGGTYSSGMSTKSYRPLDGETQNNTSVTTTTVNTGVYYKFANSITISAYGDQTNNFGSWRCAYRYTEGTYAYCVYYKNIPYGSISSYGSTANSVITYIDLDAVD